MSRTIVGLCVFANLLSASVAGATPVTSAANIPFSGISPGGVSMATGELILVMRPDLVVNGPFPLVFQRYYASMLQREGFASGRLGPNWLMTYDWKLTISSGNARLVTNRGEVIRFTMGPTGSWDLFGPTYARFKLDMFGAGAWRFTNPVDRHIYFFDGTGTLTQVQDEHGNALNLTYAPGGGPLSQVQDGLGRTFTLGYEPTTGLLAQVTDGTRTISFGYTTGELSSFLDAAGKPWIYTRQPGPIQALITGIIEPLGNTPITHSYDALGRVQSQTDALSNTAQYAYDTASGNVYTDPQGNPWTYLHDPLKLTSIRDPNGGNTNYFYDPIGRLATVARPLGDPTSFDYDPASGYVSAVHYPDGNSVFFDHGPYGVAGATIYDVVAGHYPDGGNVAYGRDPAGNLTNFLDQSSFPWTGTYNARGQILTWSNPSSGVTTYTYDTRGRPFTVEDNAGNTATYSYDLLSRLTQVSWPGGSHRQFAYDNRDNLTLVQDESGNAWTYGYDDNGRLTSATDPLLHATGLVYDNADRVSQMTDALGHATLYDYDLNGRLLHATDRSGRVTTYGYDALNRLTSVTDPAGQPTTFGHDGDGRVTFAQDALLHTSSFQYDFMDRLTQVIDPVLSEFDYQYDPMGRLRHVSGPLGLSQDFVYDPRGLLRSATNGSSTVQYEYTPHRQVSQITDPNGNPWPRSYDPQGRLQSAADPLGRTYGYEYDGLNRVMRITRPDLTAEQLTYDANGNLTGRSYTDGTTFTYGYDIANRMTSAGLGMSFSYDNAGRMTASNGFSYSYDQEGRLLSQTLAPGKTESYTYGPRGLLSQVSDWVSGNTSFDYDAAHRLTGITRPNGTSLTYQYDPADRLTSAVEKSPGPIQISSIQITRDALGRVGSILRSQPLMPGATAPASSSFGYDIASQVSGVAHDPLGRTTVDGARTLRWNGPSGLKSYASGADSLDYTDDPFKNPKTITSHTGQVIQVAWGFGRGYPTNDDMAVTLPTRSRLYVRTPSGLLLHGVDGSSGARSFYHYDESGNTAFLTNDVAHVTTEYAYGPFGGVSALGLTTDNPFTFGAARGLMSLGTNAVSNGLWHDGGGVFDERTMRVVSALATFSGETNPGPTQVNPGPTQANPGPPQFPWANPGPSQSNRGPSQVNPGPIQSNPGPTQANPGEWVALNPQPFPPSPGDLVGLNPQPFPPAPGEWVGLNPQPFPPSPYAPDAVALNPQPFPPGGTLMSGPGNYGGNEPGNYAGNYAGNYGGNYAGNYGGNYPGNYVGNHAGHYSGNYGLNYGASLGSEASFKEVEGLSVKQDIVEYPEGGQREGTKRFPYSMAGTLIHELGHTVGLCHNGRDSDNLPGPPWEAPGGGVTGQGVDIDCGGNYLPNNISTMSYRYSMFGHSVTIESPSSPSGEVAPCLWCPR